MQINKLSPALFIIILTLFLYQGCKDDSPNEPGPSGQTITVNGFVKDSNGDPISGATVIVKGKSPVVTTTNGTFSVSGVTTPYEVRLVFSTWQTAMIYQGLTRPDPTLLYIQSLPTTKSVNIQGRYPHAAGKTTKIFFVSGTKSWEANMYPAQDSFKIQVNWGGTAASLTGKLCLLRWSNNSQGLPSAYDGYGAIDMTVSVGGTFSQTFTAGILTDPPEQSISGKVTVPSTSYLIIAKELTMNFEGAGIPICYEWGAALTQNFSYSVPVISGTTFEVGSTAEWMGTGRTCSFTKRCINCGTTNIDLQMNTAPQLNLPADGGTGIDTTTQFLWTNGGGSGINLVMMNGNGPTYYVLTASNTTTIPNLAPQGLGLPFGKLYDWRVVQVVPVASTDQLTDPVNPLMTGYAGDMGTGTSEVFHFVTR